MFHHKLVVGGLVAGLSLLMVFTLANGAENEKNALDPHALIELLKEKNIISDQEAEKLILRNSGGQAQAVTPVITNADRYLEEITDHVVRNIEEDVGRKIKNEIKDELAREIKVEAYTSSVPGWAKRLKIAGDIRLRYQADYLADSNADFLSPSEPTTPLNSTHDRHRFRYRSRLGVTGKINNQVTTEIRLATGNESDPVSTNDTLGDYSNKDSLTLDRAYLKWDLVPETNLWTGDWHFQGGRMPNPFMATDLVWDGDLHFEGLATTAMIPVTLTSKTYINLGTFPLQEVELTQKDKWLFAGQVGYSYEKLSFFTFTLGVGYYDYHNIEGKMNTAGNTLNDYTAPPFQQKGNAIFDINPLPGNDNVKIALAMDYDELDIISSLDISLFEPVHIILTGNYVKNLAYDHEEILARTGLSVPEEIEGYQFVFTAGHLKMRELGDWKTTFTYKYLEADAVLDAFTDSDFHLGGTNAKGWSIGLDVGLAPNFWFSGKWLTSDEIAGPQFSVDTLQVNLNARF
ncbi:MAG: putative porin [Proteobacteria bacterium]|nr:putative porin [Pseudomonadota bacterium]MBU1736859.1 putative porin [Pseudomonadota bacterium]